jgi:hypothetical protein
MEFFNKLYLGFEAEHYVMGQLYGEGFEAFKLPADFGFDLMVTNQKELSLTSNQKKRDINPPYALQIKSRRINPENFYKGPNGRSSADVDFLLSEKELGLMFENSNAYLVFVIFFANELNKIHKRAIYFWLGNSHLRILRSRGYIQPAKRANMQKDSFVIKANIRLLPMQKTDTLLQPLIENGNLTKEGGKLLKTLLPAELPVKDKAHEYISLMRPSKNGDSDEVKREVPSDLTKLANLGIDIKIPYLD